VSYLLDLLRLALLGFSQLPLSATLACAALLPLVTVALATRAMSASRGR
jgi:hypothetical protein